jgi:ATP-dependent Clp protease ATP-binding subunit ClpA
MDASNLIKPVLASGELRCIGSTTYQEYRGIFEKDRALARRFQKIDVSSPRSRRPTRSCKGLKSRFEEHHGVRYTRALRSAAELVGRYINDRHLPDKAIDVIDEAGANQQLLPPSKRKKTIGVGTSRQVVAKIARIPPKRSRLRQGGPAQPGPRPEDGGVRPGRGDRALAAAIKMARSGLGGREADRLVPVRRPDRRRQDRGHPPAGQDHGHRADPRSTCPSTWSATPSRA